MPTTVCRAILDRVQVVASPSQAERPPDLKEFRVARDSFVRPQTTISTYARCRAYECPVSATKIYWQYCRRAPWLEPWKITLIPDDQIGLQRKQLEQVICACSQYRFLMLELALDFADTSRFCREFVQRHAVFGKARCSPFEHHDEIVYGTRRSGKRVHCYLKSEVKAYRIELQLNSQLLRGNHLEHVADLVNLPGTLFPKHMRLVRFDWKKLHRHLQGRLGQRHGLEVFREAHGRASFLHEVLAYLRRQGILNVHRFLLPLSLNSEIRAEVRRWCRTFLGE